MKRIRFHIILLCCFLFLVGCIRKTDWTEHFRENSKDPFGLYILYNESEELFRPKEVKLLRQNIYDYLYDIYSEDGYQFNYLCIKNSVHKTSKDGLQELLYHVEEGSTAFFSLNYFPEYLKEELNFQIKTSETYPVELDDDSTIAFKKRSGTLRFTNNDFNENSYNYDRNLNLDYFSSYDETTTVVLGTSEIDREEKPMFLKVYYGKGTIYLHTEPTVFTNYNLLKENYEYAEKALSYLPEEDVFWDPQRRYSSFDSQKDDDESSSSIFNFFLANPSLKWFLYVIFSGMVIFLLFNARRKQRPIPVINAPKNSTLEFTHTISNLYLLNNEHQNLAEKKIQYFLEKVRSRYFLDTSNLNSDFITKLALKSGNDLKSTQQLIEIILYRNGSSSCTPEELMRLNKLIDNYLKPNTHGRTK